MKLKRTGYEEELNILKMNNIISEIKNSIDEIYSTLDTGKEELANWEWVIKIYSERNRVRYEKYDYKRVFKIPWECTNSFCLYLITILEEKKYIAANKGRMIRMRANFSETVYVRDASR